MMMSEFIERTHIEPSYEEYHYIEESYYEFNGDKNEFCKAWLKDKKSGKWDLEYRLRKALDDQKAQYEARLKEKEETLEFYRTYTGELRERAKMAENQLRGIKQILGISAPAVQV
jgi:hypothetical protein